MKCRMIIRGLGELGEPKGGGRDGVGYVNNDWIIS